MKSYLYISLVIAVGILLTLIPIKYLRKYTAYFSFKKFGIRKKKRWNALLDDLGNTFLVISFLFCALYWLIPYFEWIYVVWLLFTGLCTLSRSAIITSHYPNTKGSQFKAALVNMLIFDLMGIGLGAGFGLLNNNAFYGAIAAFRLDLRAGYLMSMMYYLTNPTFFYILLEGLILFIPLMTLWNHFKYMRTERTIRAANIVTYVFKMILICVVLFILAHYGFAFLDMVYHVDYTLT